MVVARLIRAVYELLNSQDKPVSTKDIFRFVKNKVPDLCDDSDVPCQYDEQNHPTWKHDVHWALQELKRRRLAERVDRGYWKAISQSAAPTSMVQKPEVQEGREHERIKGMIKEIGEAIGKYVEVECRDSPYVYDVVWRDIELLPPTHVFEVHDRGNIDAALAKLQHARDLWRPQLFLVVVGERDRVKATRLLEPYIRGSFHKIARYVSILSPDDVYEIHRIFTGYREIIERFLRD